jgi:hypothetical protein
MSCHSRRECSFLNAKQPFELVAFYSEKLFTEQFSVENWNDYWILLEACGWDYHDFMIEMEKRVSREWITICMETNLCSN